MTNKKVKNRKYFLPPISLHNYRPIIEAGNDLILAKIKKNQRDFFSIHLKTWFTGIVSREEYIFEGP
jgi:hypothetical protein